MSTKREVIREFLKFMEVTNLDDGKRKFIQVRLSNGSVIKVAISLRKKTVKLKLIKTG